jgi:tetratricopeptide (TPR) repeat protein
LPEDKSPIDSNNVSEPVQAQDKSTAENADALYAQGMAHYRRREWPEARDCFARLKTIAPGRRGVDALLNEVDIFIQLQEMQPQGTETSFVSQVEQEALPSHTVVTRVAEKHAVPKHRSLGPVLLLMVAAILVVIAVLYATGALDTIIGNQRQARVRSLVNQGRAALNVGDCNRAATAFGEALALAPTNEEIQTWYAKAQRCQQLTALYEQAEAAIAAAQWNTALQKLGEVIQLDPTYKDASDKIDDVKSQQLLDSRLIEAQDYLEQDDWNAAIQVLEELKEQAPSFRVEDVDRTLFLAYFRKGISLLAAAGDSPDDLMQAIQNFDLALAVSPGDATAEEERRLADLYRQARLAFNQQNWPQAVLVLSEIHASRPGYMDGRARSLLCTAYLRLGGAYEAAGDLEQALDQYRNVLAIEGCDPVEAAIKVRDVRSTLYPPTATPTRTPRPTPTLVPTATATVTPTPIPTGTPPPQKPTSPPQKPTSPPPRTPTR